ncbi:DUF3302 domain-containing protein [Aliivibrio fischeri]|uniref:DUF3302 domain-containing protein n=1 Tax=Aliivibrio fischeri TaxID=668 RepID=UPI0012D97FD6|nr:DUF3302 domain-containing protein [Aliivibrio fischeri]MUL03162.1 DUF3302 domain-containing protein [Aliivibrio fischeri]
MNIFLDYASLGVLFIVLLIFIYGLIIVHDIPYEMALKRNHPHAEAIHVAGWISLFFLHVLWPFLWIWASMYNGDKQAWLGEKDKVSAQEYSSLVARINELEKQIKE